MPLEVFAMNKAMQVGPYGRCRRATGEPTSVRFWPIADIRLGERARAVLRSASDPKRTFSAGTAAP